MFPPTSRKSRKSRTPASLISASCERPGLRLFLLGCLFMLIMSVYWWNFEKRMAKLQPPDGSHSIINQGDLLQKTDLDFLYAWRSKFQKEWNVPLLLQVSRGSLELPPYPASTLYMGVGVSHAEAVIAVPPLVRKALGEGLRIEAEETLSLCIKNELPAETVRIVTTDKDTQEESVMAEQKALASKVVAHCLDTALNHLWKSL